MNEVDSGDRVTGFQALERAVSVLDVVAEHPVVRAHARRPYRPDALEVKGGMPRVHLEEVEVLISE